MSPGIHHLAIKAAQVGPLADYYAQLGLPELRRHHDPKGLRAVWLQLGEAILMIERAGDPPQPGPDDPPGGFVLALSMPPEARAGWERRLAALGTPVQDRSPFSLYFRDPEGNRLALSSWPDPSEPP